MWGMGAEFPCCLLVSALLASPCVYPEVCWTLYLWEQWLIIIAVIKTAFSRVWLFAAPWAIAHQAPLSLKFSKQEYWSGLPFPTPGDRPDPGMEPTSPALAGEFFTTEPPGKPGLYLDSAVVNILPYLCPFLYESTCMCVFFFFSEPFEHKLLIWAKN